MLNWRIMEAYHTENTRLFLDKPPVADGIINETVLYMPCLSDEGCDSKVLAKCRLFYERGRSVKAHFD